MSMNMEKEEKKEEIEKRIEEIITQISQLERNKLSEVMKKEWTQKFGWKVAQTDKSDDDIDIKVLKKYPALKEVLDKQIVLEENAFKRWKEDLAIQRKALKGIQ